MLRSACPFCELKISCRFSSYWNISNFTAHIRQCMSKNVVKNQARSLAQSETSVGDSNPGVNEKQSRKQFSLLFIFCYDLLPSVAMIFVHQL